MVRWSDQWSADQGTTRICKKRIRELKTPISGWSGKWSGGGQVTRGWSGADQVGKTHFLPANQSDDDAKFLTHEELVHMLGHDPQNAGFAKTRAWVEGQRKRGYWVKTT